MFIVLLTAEPTPTAREFSSVAGAKVRVFTCMLTEEDAVEVARSMILDSLWQVTSIDDVFWFGEEQGKIDPEMSEICRGAREDGPTFTYEFFGGASEAGSIN